MRKMFGFTAIFVTTCSGGIANEQKWANFMGPKYPSGIEHIALTTLAEEGEYTLDIKLKPGDVSDFKNIMQDIDGFLQNHPKRKSILVIDTSKLDNSIVISVLKDAQVFGKSYCNYSTQDVAPKAGVKDIDPTLALINKRNFFNLYHFAVVLAGDNKPDAQNLRIPKHSLNTDTSSKINIDVVAVEAKKS